MRQLTSDQLLSIYIDRAGDLSAYASCLCIIRFFRSVESTSPMPARAGNFAREFRRTFRRRRWPQGPTRNGRGCSSLWESHSGLSRFSGTGFSTASMYHQIFTSFEITSRCQYSAEISHVRSFGRYRTLHSYFTCDIPWMEYVVHPVLALYEN